MEAVKDFTPADLQDMGAHFAGLSRHVPLSPITSPEGYDRSVAAMNALLDAGAGNEDHPLAELLDLLGKTIADYDDKHHHIPAGSPVGALRVLMEQHGLRQSDFAAEIGSQGVVSEVLAGKRDLNVKQIARLAARFGVAPGAFIEA